MQSDAGITVILATGGTIAGTAAQATDHVGYVAAQLGVTELVEAVPALAGVALETEQVAEVDSKDMSHAIWQRLAQRLTHHLARDDVTGVVITHGTDTLEETAYVLHRVLAPRKPVVLTAAMRPATALQADGPQNLLDAMTLARSGGPGGVWVAVQGAVFDPRHVSKRHPYRLQAFDAGEAGLAAVVEQGAVRWLRGAADRASRVDPDLPPDDYRAAVLTADPQRWPRVDIVLNHAGADGALARAAVFAGAHGLVVAGTGNGTLSAGLHAALDDARRAGITVWRCSRCADGVVVGADGVASAAVGDALALPPAVPLSAVKARAELMLWLLAQPEQA